MNFTLVLAAFLDELSARHLALGIILQVLFMLLDFIIECPNVLLLFFLLHLALFREELQPHALDLPV